MAYGTADADEVAQALASGDGDYSDGLGGWLDVRSDGRNVNIKFTPATEDGDEDKTGVVYFAATVTPTDGVW